MKKRAGSDVQNSRAMIFVDLYININDADEVPKFTDVHLRTSDVKIMNGYSIFFLKQN